MPYVVALTCAVVTLAAQTSDTGQGRQIDETFRGSPLEYRSSVANASIHVLLRERTGAHPLI